MGGPCYVVDAASTASAFRPRRRRLGPACTDNFQLKPFDFEGTRYHSCEHAYQAKKFRTESAAYARIVAIVPFAAESAPSHGGRCWREGQRYSEQTRSDWEAEKINVMLAVNRAKYAQHEGLRAELLATGTAEIVGAPSTQWKVGGKEHTWSTWNGRIQMRVREELRPESERVPGKLEELVALFDAYVSEVVGRGAPAAGITAAAAEVSHG